MTDDRRAPDPPGTSADPPATPADPPGTSAEPAAPPHAVAAGSPPGRAARRPLVERVGMAAIAAVLAVLFGGVAALSFASGEPFLGVMAVVGTLMTAWAGLLTLVRG